MDCGNAGNSIDYERIKIGGFDGGEQEKEKNSALLGA
jgi:hypothetical protein